MRISIAIVVLTKDEPDFLDKTIRSIIARTNYPYELFIVDNDSSLDKQKTLLKSYKQDGLAHVIFNNKNQWVLGFNKAIDIVNTRTDLSSEYVVLTDGDIVVPEPIGLVCWLEYFMQKMDGNITIGKLGLALDTQFIKDNKKFDNTYANELRYMKGPIVDDLVIAPVDTTLAIYRRDLFVTNTFKMLPGHGSLIRPYYYVFRTSGSYVAQHLGWQNYMEPDINQIQSKVICFAKYGGYVDPIVLDKVGSKVRYFYKIFGRIYKAYWALITSYYWVVYFYKKFPRSLNEIQFNLR
jgi:glycosyltransferase involved in cell wall biosynthesis